MFVAAMRDEKMDMRFRLEAANWLVERYGKPAMQVAAQSENDGSEQKEFRTVEEVRLFLLERGIDVARLPVRLHLALIHFLIFSSACAV
jgi:hypothetical protein